MQSTAPKPGQSAPALRICLDFPGALESIRSARAWTTGALENHDITVPPMLPLVVSELTTNAVIHTRSGHPYGRYSLSVAVSSDQLRVEVGDAGPLPGRFPARVWAHPEATHGRGLALVDTFATRWGRLSSGSGVWAEVAR